MSKTKRLIYLALLTSMAIALQVFESMIAVPLPYGAKLGLANIIALVTMELFDVKELILVNFIKGNIFNKYLLDIYRWSAIK